MKKTIITVGIIIVLAVCIFYGTRHYFTEKKHNEYLSDFLKYTEMAVDAWEHYEETNDVLSYQHGVVNFYIAVDYFDRYSYEKKVGVTHELKAFNEIRIDLYSDVTTVKPYFAKLKDALAKFDDTYLFGSHELFITIFEIENEIQ